MVPFFPYFIAAWSALPPRVPTNHSPSPQKLTNCCDVISSPCSANADSAVATTSADEELKPAATGMFPQTEISMPLQQPIRVRHLESQDGCFDIEAPITSRLSEMPRQFARVDHAHPIVPVELTDKPADGDGDVRELVRVDVAGFNQVVGTRRDGHNDFLRDGHQIAAAPLPVDMASHHVDPSG